MKSDTDVCKGLYCEALAGEIIIALGNVIDIKAREDMFQAAHTMIYNIIAREYVEKDDQIIHGKQIHKRKS